jgi:hypothetical protein
MNQVKKNNDDQTNSNDTKYDSLDTSMKFDFNRKNITAYILTWLFIGVLLLTSFTYIFSSRIGTI